MASYSDKLRDPRWQKKRLEIMQRDGFACVECNDSRSPLNIHHAFYETGRAPWEYPPCSLRTLCEKCHKRKTELLIFLSYRLGFFTNEQIKELTDQIASGQDDEFAGFLERRTRHSLYSAPSNSKDVKRKDGPELVAECLSSADAAERRANCYSVGTEQYIQCFREAEQFRILAKLVQQETELASK